MTESKRTAAEVAAELNASDFLLDCGCDDALGCPCCEPAQWTFLGEVAA